MSRLLNNLAQIAMGMAVMSGAGMYDDDEYRRPTEYRVTDKERKLLRQRSAQGWYEYTINGEVIKARNKLDARKIYNKRHGKNK